jgi:hypothetical protein
MPDQPTGGASHETDRHADDQPPREDVIPADTLEDLDVEEADEALSEDDPVLPRPGPDDLPESQGFDVAQGDRIAEDPADRPALSDEGPLH